MSHPQLIVKSCLDLPLFGSIPAVCPIRSVISCCFWYSAQICLHLCESAFVQFGCFIVKSSFYFRGYHDDLNQVKLILESAYEMDDGEAREGSLLVLSTTAVSFQ